MNAQALIDRLEAFPAVLRPLAGAVSDQDGRWKPASGAWSINEIVHHLADEEELDFRPRLRRTLHDPAAPWEPIDPEGWAVSRRYNDGDIHLALDRFIRERAESVDWLRALPDPDWSLAHTHPKLGPIRAGALLASWTAHDLLHLRQITKRLFELTRRDAGAHPIDYAGAWTA